MLMKTDLQAKPDEIKLFLNTIFKHCSIGEGFVALRAFAHEGNVSTHQEWRKFDAGLPDRVTQVATVVAHFLQSEKSSVFCPPVCLFKLPTKAVEDNVLCAPAVTVELDSGPTEALDTLRAILGEPTCIVASGGTWQGQDKLHLHWRLERPATGPDLPMLKAVRRYAAAIVKADMTAVPVVHPLRWPGSWHTKGEPRLCRIIGGDQHHDVNLYDAYAKLSEIAEQMNIEGLSAEPNTEGFKTDDPWTADALNAAASTIENEPHENPEQDWHMWNKYGMAFYDASHGSEDGRAAFHTISAKHDKYDPGTTDARWDHYHRSPPTRTSAGTLIYEARKVDPDFHKRVGDPSIYFESSPPPAKNLSKPFFTILTLDQIAQLPPPKFLIDRHVPEQSVGFLYGDPGTGKSFIALDWALHIAYDKPTWHGDPLIAPDGGMVVYLAGEGASGMRTRSQAWKQQHGYSHDSDRFGLLGGAVNFMSKDDGPRLLASLKHHAATFNRPISMIVVDTVSRSMPGADENSQKEMTLFVRACDLLRDEFGCAVVGVHHANKSGDMRGSTVLLGAGDFVLKLERKKGHQVGYLHCEKQKDAPDGWKDSYRFDVVSVGEKESSLVPMRLNSVDAETVPQGLEEAMLSALQAAWDRGDPWARKHQGRDRWAVKRMVQDFAMDAHDAELKLEEWISAGVVTESIRNRKDKKKGLARADFSEPDASEWADGEEQQGAFD